MNIEEVEKIKGLVKSSAILSASERAEWLALFDLMNDKQLGELEKILIGDIKTTPTLNQSSDSGLGRTIPSRLGGTPLLSKEGNTAAPWSPPPSQGGVPPLGGEVVGASNLAKGSMVSPSSFAKASEDLRQMPKLSHIVNLPNLMPNFPKASLDKQVPFSPAKLSQDLAQKKPSAFMGKLKSMFAEKELPPGHPENELELPAGQYPISNIQYPIKNPIFAVEKKPLVPFVAPKPVLNAAPLLAPLKPLPPAPPIPPKPKIVSKPELPPKPVIETLKPADFRKDFSLDKILKLEQKPQAKAFAPEQKPQAKIPSESAPIPPSSATALLASIHTSAPGINFPKISDADKNQVLKDLKEDLQNKPPAAPMAVVITPLANEQALNSLQDLTKIEAETLKGSALDALVKKIRLLISKYGYFEVVFNIEKSQAYKKYIATGLKLLSGKDSFDNLLMEGGDDYLSKAQFEKFTDLLAKIQTS